MKHNKPVILDDKEIDAIQTATALIVVKAENGNAPRIPHLLSAVLKIGKSRYDSDVELPAERLSILDD
jgi:hypothetical protein